MLTTALWGRSALVMGKMPGHIKDARGICFQFSHVIDNVPNIYEAVGIALQKIMDGVEQKLLECTSLVCTFDSAKTPTRHTNISSLSGDDGWCQCEAQKSLGRRRKSSTSV